MKKYKIKLTYFTNNGKNIIILLMILIYGYKKENINNIN